MMPTATIARDKTPEGKELVLSCRHGVYCLRLDGRELMSSRAHGSEDALARLACEGLQGQKRPRVLVGGLGFGYTVRATLDRLPSSSTVVVCEVFDSLLAWNRTHLAELAGRPLEDPRIEIVRADVWDLLHRSRPFDAILLDVDNGPWAFTLRSNERLYGPEGLALLAASLTASGRLAVWSSEAAPSFEQRLYEAGFDTRSESVPARLGGRSPRHTVFVAVHSAEPRPVGS